MEDAWYPTLALVSSDAADSRPSSPKIPIKVANFRIISQRKDDRILLEPALPRRLNELLLLLKEWRLLTDVRRKRLKGVVAVVVLMPTRCFQSASAINLYVLTTAALTLSSSHVTCELNGAINSARDCRYMRHAMHKP
jgi:hypothetical protein